MEDKYSEGQGVYLGSMSPSGKFAGPLMVNNLNCILEYIAVLETCC